MTLRKRSEKIAVGIAQIIFAVVGGLRAEETDLVRNAEFAQTVDGKPVCYELTGSAVYHESLTDRTKDVSDGGITLSPVVLEHGIWQPSVDGSVFQIVAINTLKGRSFSFRFRGLPQDGFATTDDGLYMEVEFFGSGGQPAYDGKRKSLYPLVRQARRDLTVNGDNHLGGAAVWRDYVLNFYVPFPQVGLMKLTVACKGGLPPAQAESALRRDGPPTYHFDTAGRAFLLTDFRLVRLPNPTELKNQDPSPVVNVAAEKLMPLGGRWFYRPRPGEMHAPLLFDHTNVDRLLYHDRPGDEYDTPFADNTSAVLHAGNEDAEGNVATSEQLVADNVTVRFEMGKMILHTHGLPNHPTGRFPEDGFGPGFNPNRIQEQDETYEIPLQPKVNPSHFVTTANNSNHALNMGPIGIAVNGVVFFNPFDAGSMDASNIMDRCCGHPNQDGQYHYHKYPVCLNSHWNDEGKAHSPLLGWAFDGFPIYGPYESANVMAKDVTGPSALNAFNLHYDPQRGWHYHVTPGRFPYLIGGYWGRVERRNVHPPHGGGLMGEGDAPPWMGW